MARGESRGRAPSGLPLTDAVHHIERVQQGRGDRHARYTPVRRFLRLSKVSTPAARSTRSAVNAAPRTGGNPHRPASCTGCGRRGRPAPPRARRPPAPQPLDIFATPPPYAAPSPSASRSRPRTLRRRGRPAGRDTLYRGKPGLRRRGAGWRPEVRRRLGRARALPDRASAVRAPARPRAGPERAGKGGIWAFGPRPIRQSASSRPTQRMER